MQTKQKTCKWCKTKFTPERPSKICCSPDCEYDYGLKHASRAEANRAREDRKTIKIRKEALKTPHQKRSALIQKVEKSIRDVRRTEELMKGSGCISCGRSQAEVIGTDGWKPGGAFDAGHYLGKGARPNLRLTPDNIWLQCKSCNAGSSKYARKSATVAKQFRENLIPILGLARVEELDADDRASHWTDEELNEMLNANRAKLKELKNV